MPNDWGTATIADITLQTSTWNPERNPRDAICYVDVSAVSRDKLAVVSVARHSKGDAPSRARKIVRAKDTIFATIRPALRRIAQVPDELDNEIASTAFCVLRPNLDKVDPDYLFFAVQSDSFARAVSAHESGASYPAVRDGDVFAQRIPLPPLPEQRQIASALSVVRQAYLGDIGVLDGVAVLASAASRDVFIRGLRKEALRQSEIGLIPESWSVAPIGTLASVRGGKRMPKGTSLVREDTGRPYIRVTDFFDHGVAGRGVLFVPRGVESEIARYTIGRNDVYISIAGTIGLVGQVPAALDGANLTENAAKLCAFRADVLPRFVMYALSSPSAQAQIAQVTAKNAQPKLALTRIEQILVGVPPTLGEQQQIIDVLDMLALKKRLHDDKRAAVHALMRSLVEQLTSGSIRVADLERGGLPNSLALERA